MATTEERARVLRMVEQGVVSAEEGARLLAAMSDAPAGRAHPSAHPGPRNRTRTQRTGRGRGMLRLRLTDAASGRRRIDVQIPTGVLDFLVAAGGRVGLLDADLGGIDLEELHQAISGGGTGRVLDWFDEDSGQRVEVYLE